MIRYTDKTGMAAYQIILKIIITIKPATPRRAIIPCNAKESVHSADSFIFTCRPTGWGAALPTWRKGFNHNKSRLWPSSQEQSAVWLHSLSRLPSSCWLPGGFLSFDQRCKSMSRQFTNQTGMCDSCCSSWPQCCCPTVGYKGADGPLSTTREQHRSSFKASVSSFWVNTWLHRRTQTSEQKSTAEQFVFFLNKRQLCSVCCHCSICGSARLTNGGLDSTLRSKLIP